MTVGGGERRNQVCPLIGKSHAIEDVDDAEEEEEEELEYINRILLTTKCLFFGAAPLLI